MTSATCKPNSSFPLKPLTAAMLLVFSANVQTAPVLDGVLDNNLSIDVSLPGTTVITQEVNQRDVINWQEFSIGVGETVRFDQPDVNAVIVNRVNGGIRSDIFGSLVANGRVFLINPSGIVFGSNATVNVNGLVASTLSLKNGASGRGEPVEFRAANGAGSIVNEGSITAKDIVLLAPSITNTGNLTATGDNASVSLVAADEVSVSTMDGNLNTQVLESSNGGLIEQLGQVLAEGGRVILLASSSSNGAPSVINTAGVNQASEIRIQGDLIQLTGDFNVGNTAGRVEVIANSVSQSPDDSNQALSVGGALNLNVDNVSLSNAGNDFVGRVDLTASNAVEIKDSNSLQVSVNAGGIATLDAENLTLNRLTAEELRANASGIIVQTEAVQVSGRSVLTANDINLSNSGNQFGGDVIINSIGDTTVHASDEIQISGSSGTLNLTAEEITQRAALVVSGTSALNASQVTLLDSENDFVGNVALSVTGSVNLNDRNSLSVSGTAGDLDLTALDAVQFNDLEVDSLGVTAASVTQTGALTVQQDTAMSAGSVQLTDQSNNFLGVVQMNNVGEAELSDQNTLTLAGQVSTLRATAANINQTEQSGPLAVANTASFNGGDVDLLQAGNTFGGNVILNVDGHAQVGTSGDLLVSGRAGAATFNADSVGQGDAESDALLVLGQTRINNSNTVELNNEANQFGSQVILQNAGTVNLKGTGTLAVQGTTGLTALATGASGQIVVNGLTAENLTATASSINQTDFLNVIGNSTLNAENIDLTGSDNNQFGNTVTVRSGGRASIKSDGSLTVTGEIATGSFEADSLIFNGLDASNNIVLSAGSVTQSMDNDRALRVQGETRINNSGAVTLNNAVNDFEGEVVLNTQGSVRLTDSNTLVIEGQAGALDLTAQTIIQNGALGVQNVTSLSADTVTLNDLNNDFQGRVDLLGNGRVSLRDANTLSVAGNAQELALTAGVVEINNALNVNDRLTMITNAATQAASGAAALTVGGDTNIQHNNPDSYSLVQLNNTNNDFTGLVTLSNQVNVDLADRNTLTVQGEAGSFSATAAALEQIGDLTVQHQATLNADTVAFTNSANDFAGTVVLNSTGNVSIHEQQVIALQGSASSLDVRAGTEINQSGAINVSGTTHLAASTINLTHAANNFAGDVSVNAIQQANVSAGGDLSVGGNAGALNVSAQNELNLTESVLESLNVTAQQVGQSGVVSVEGPSSIKAQNASLLNGENDFNGVVTLDVESQADIADTNNLLIQGNARILTTAVAGTLTAGELSIGSGTLIADEINVNQLEVTEDVNLQAERVAQTQAVQSGGNITIRANEVDLVDQGNDFSGRLILQNVGAATIGDINELNLSGQVGTLAVDAQRITQGQGSTAALSVQGRTDLRAANVDLQNTANDFSGVVDLQVSDAALLRDTNDLVIQGDVGTMNIRAANLTQFESLTVRNSASIAADSVKLDNAANDFQEGLSLEVTGDTQVVDINQLQVAGDLNTATLSANTLMLDKLVALGDVTFNANSTVQNGELSVGGTSTFNGDSIALGNAANNFDGVVNLNLTGSASLVGSGDLEVTGSAVEVDAKAGALAVSSLTAGDITLQANQLELINFATAGNLTLNGGNVIQQGALQVGGTTSLGASNVTLQDQGNHFQGDVVLTLAGDVALRTQQAVSLQGSASSLDIQAGRELTQSAALNVSGASDLTASTINLENSANNFGGPVTLNAAGQATVVAGGNLSVGGNASAMTIVAEDELVLSNSTLGTLNATARQISQSGVLTVSDSSALHAESLTLFNANNDLGASVNLDVTGQASVADRNSVLIQGRAETLNTVVADTLTAGELSIVSGNLQAGEINLNQLEVNLGAELRAERISQTQASQSGGTLTLRANEVDLSMTGNDFSGQVILQNVNIASIRDTNDLILSGRVNNLSVDAQRLAQLQDQSGALIVQGTSDLRAANVDLQNAANNFSGAVELQVSDTAQLRDANSLLVQGDVGNLNARAVQLTQADALIVRNNSSLEAASVQLNNSANDFHGDVALNVTGSASIADANNLSISGQINGTTEFRAQSIEQTGALVTGNGVLLQANRIDLANEGNTFKGVVRVEGASEAILRSTETLRVQGTNLSDLNLQAQEVSLGDLGELRQLNVAAVEVRQTAALIVQGDTNLRSSKIELNNPDNDFVGLVSIQNSGAGNAAMAVADRNDLAMQAENLSLDAQVLGNFELQANNVELGVTQVDGASQIELTGALTQKRAVNLNNASIKANQITLANSGNQFSGNTQVQTAGMVALGTSGDLNVDTTSSTGTLALNVDGDARVEGAQVQFADSQIGGELTVSANQIIQAGRLQVEGHAEFEAIGGQIDLRHEGNRFQGTVSASAEQTSLTTGGDMQLLNLNSRGGQLTAAGRIFLLGNIEQTGGALTFTAKGVSRPLSSADIALLLPPSLDVFSNKEAANPLTGLGRITLASPMIHQRSGQLVTAAGATTQFNSPENGSVVLTQNNQINGRLGVLAGQNYGQTFGYVIDRGASLFAINNDVRLNIGGEGAEADVIAIRARGLATLGNEAVIHARMPYNDTAVGTARSYAGLTLSIPLGGSNGQPGGLATFGESAGSGQAPGTGAIRVEVGDINRPGLGGFLTVLPFEGSNLLPGQVVYLAGPERKGTQAFFYDGARSLDRIPVVYNGTLLLSPQENAALTTAQGAVVLARQEQTRSVVRTENVAGKIINGVVAEVGPGRPATEGEGGAGKPATCDAEDSGLSCAP